MIITMEMTMAAMVAMVATKIMVMIAVVRKVARKTKVTNMAGKAKVEKEIRKGIT